MTTAEQLAALGDGDASKPFDLEIDGVAIRVQPAGDDNEVTLWAPYVGREGTGDYRGGGVPRLRGPRPLYIALAREDDDDREAKRTGVSRELQTGDAAFDELVYITTERPDELVRGVLSSEVRRAACELLRAGFDKIVIDDENARITAHCRGSCSAGADDIARTFAALANHVPAVEASSVAHVGWWPAGVFGLAMVVAVPVVVASAMIAVAWYWPIVATVVGGVAGIAAGRLLGKTQRGRSDSHVRRQIVTGASLLAGIVIGNLVALYLLEAIAWVIWATVSAVIAIVAVVLATRDY
jgi:hypothetical protein